MKLPAAFAPAGLSMQALVPFIAETWQKPVKRKQKHDCGEVGAEDALSRYRIPCY